MICDPVEAFGKPLAQVLREMPRPQGTEVLLRVGHCGVCHSDLHLHDGCYDLGDGQKLDVGKGMNLPRVLGHEIAGTVVALGPDVTSAMGVAINGRKIGDTVSYEAPNGKTIEVTIKDAKPYTG